MYVCRAVSSVELEAWSVECGTSTGDRRQVEARAWAWAWAVAWAWARNASRGRVEGCAACGAADAWVAGERVVQSHRAEGGSAGSSAGG